MPGKIVDIRDRMAPSWRHCEDMSAARSVLLLDISLETFFRTRVEAMTDVDALSGDEAADLLLLVLRGHCISAGCTPEMGNAHALLHKLLHEPPAAAGERWSGAWALHAVAVLDNVALSVASVLDTICALVQEPAGIFLDKVDSVDGKYVANFGEEVARGHPLYLSSGLLRKLSTDARDAAGLGPWQLISAGPAGAPAVGRVVVKDLAAMQGSAHAEGAETLVVLSKELGGLEDVPAGVTAVLTAAPVDLLSHIAIRARNTGTLLATCADAGLWETLVESVAGSVVTVAAGAGGGDVDIAAAPDAAAARGAAAGGDAADRVVVRLPDISAPDAWALPSAAFAPGAVGGKALGVRALADLAAGGDFAVPPAFALPFGAFDRAVAAGPPAVKARLDAAVAVLEAAAPAGEPAFDMTAVRAALAGVRGAVADVERPPALAADVAAAVAGADASVAPWAAVDDAAWGAIKAVWASKWTERAFLSRRTFGIPEADLSMSVLCMGLLPAHYAFVLHTRSPLPDAAADEVFGEVVVGLGETLVGNSPGRAFSFAAPRADPDAFDILALPSKIEAQYAPDTGEPTLIARSDSNGEDLEGFAGAGLYESHPTAETQAFCPNYVDEALLWDEGFRLGLVRQLVALAITVEENAGAPQDVEGCFVAGEPWLLQSRAQV